MHGKAEHRGLQPPARAGNVTCRTCIVALAALVLTGLHGVADSFVPAAFTAIHVRAGLGRLAHSTGGARRAPHGGASATSCRAHAVALRMQSDGAASPPPPPRGPGGSAGGPNVGVGGSGWSRPTDVQGKGSGQLGATLGQIMARKRQLAAGGLRQLPRVYPADEILNRADGNLGGGRVQHVPQAAARAGGARARQVEGVDRRVVLDDLPFVRMKGTPAARSRTTARTGRSSRARRRATARSARRRETARTNG